MRADKNSTKEFGLTQNHSDTSTNFSCQIHVGTRVVLELRARFNQRQHKTLNGKQLEIAAASKIDQVGF
jgi:hypothetical protein